MADFPTGVYTPREKLNKTGIVYDPAQKTVGYAEDVVNLDDEVVAIETELGANPKGVYETVAAYLAALAGAISNLVSALGDKVDKIAGKGLSTNDYDDTAESKLAGIESGANVTDIGNIAAAITGAAAKTTMTAADLIPIIDSEASNVGKTLTWAYVKSILKIYFDSLYATAPIFKNGSTTRALNGANGAQNIAHGLGKVPKNVKISAMFSYSENISIANTSYNGTAQSSNSMYFKVFSGEGSADTFNITFVAAGEQVGVVTFDETNIIITWTKNGAPPAGTIRLLWEATA